MSSKRSDLESSLQKEVKDWVYCNLGITSSKLEIVGEAGYPDQIFWLPNGSPLLIEFKAPGLRVSGLSKLQEDIHEKLLNLGYMVETHDNAKEAIDSILTKMESRKLPKESREILARARGCWGIL